MMTSWQLEKTRLTFARLMRWSLARWKELTKTSCEYSPSDLLWLLGRRHHSDRMPAHILQGNIPHLSCVHLHVILQSCIVKHLEDNINCPECEVIFSLCWSPFSYTPTHLLTYLHTLFNYPPIYLLTSAQSARCFHIVKVSTPPQVMIHQSHPLDYIAFDRTMQDIVYKLVFGILYEFTQYLFPLIRYPHWKRMNTSGSGISTLKEACRVQRFMKLLSLQGSDSSCLRMFGI